MLKTVADALSQFYEAAINGPDAADHAKAVHVPEMVGALRMDTVELVQRSVVISSRYGKLVNAARLYAASDPTKKGDMIAGRHGLKIELHAFARALDRAEPDDGAAFLSGMNTSHVPNPLAGPL